MKCVGTTIGTSRPRPPAMSSPKSRDARNVFHSPSLIAASCFLISIDRRLLALLPPDRRRGTSGGGGRRRRNGERDRARPGRRRYAIGVKQRREQLDAVDDTRPGPAEVRVPVEHVRVAVADGAERGPVGPIGEDTSLAQGALGVEAAREQEQEPWVGREQLLPRDVDRRDERLPEQILAPRD